MRRLLTIALFAPCLLATTACTHRLPSTGPETERLEQPADGGTAGFLQLVDIDAGVSRQLQAQRRQRLFSEAFGNQRQPLVIGSGDFLEVTLWEAPPAALFGDGVSDARRMSSTRSTTIPEQMVDESGYIAIPFAGRVLAKGSTPEAIGAEIVRRLTGKANQPEALVRVTRNASSTVTVVGEVVNSTRVPLTAGNERLLDALALAGGVRQPIAKTTVQLTRGGTFLSLPLDRVVTDPAQNIRLQSGDVIAALHQPLSFTAFGATGRNEEISFEAQGITLAQALARVGGLLDNRSDARGVFIFRYETADALNWPSRPVSTTPDGLVPVVYRIDLQNPASFLVMQGFPISNRDVLYVSNAPAAELQKFLNLVFTIAYPVLSTIQIAR